MKILKLKFKNINSLLGENEIDFTSNFFTSDGLFAITGKTGAGKTSILDAISLALYGKTPRVEITGSENAVMTRGEKDCYSEIAFEVDGKIWKSSWKQERTRTGNLKPINRLIADNSDKIIADQVKTCDIKIVEIIGLSFEQFTKVIMLSQGSFAAFLQADKNDKGELLEQITGTEIYGEISKKVFEKNKIEKENLEKIILEIDAIKILSDEDSNKLKDEISVLERDKKNTETELQNIEIAKKWLLDVESLKKQINDAKQKLPKLEEKTKTAKENLEKTENNLKTAKEEQKKQEPIYKKVRELDTKFSEKEKLSIQILKAISEKEDTKNKLSKTLVSQNEEMEKHQKKLIEEQIWKKNNAKYEELVSSFTAIENENNLLTTALQELNKINLEKNTLQQDLNVKKNNVTEKSKAYNIINQKLAEKNKELETKKTELEQILQNKELSEYQAQKEKIVYLGTQIKNIIEIEKEILKKREAIIDFDEIIKECETKINTAQIKNDDDKKIVLSLETTIRLLDENIKFSKLIQSLDEHRSKLKDGEACPLCGSLEHPYSLGNIPQIDKKEEELQSSKNEFNKISQIIQQNTQTLTKLLTEKENAIRNKEKEEKFLSENELKQKTLLLEIKDTYPYFSIENEEDRLFYFEQTYLQKQKEYKHIEEVIKKAANNIKQLAQLRDNEIPVLQQEKYKTEKEKNEAETAQKLAEQQLITKQEFLNTQKEKYEKENLSFFNKLEKYNVNSIKELKVCLANWIENNKQIEIINSKIINLKQEISIKDKEILNIATWLQEKQLENKTIETEKQKLLTERKEIFGTKLVDEEENKLKKLLENIEDSKTKMQQENYESYTELEKNKAIILEKEQDLIEKQKEIITNKNDEELQADFNEKKVKLDEFSQKIGANNQILKFNDENLKNNENKLKEKERQEQIYKRWNILSELIGSSDGKKYRNFAQALTFEHLIALSNKQLQKMSDRYILKRIGDSSNPFELSVIDKYQNNEERIAQNLSGGEKFIVSLSLALGLANMASKNMRIDTMFIDEGFGTLDADYLDLAISALLSLQSEGKVIGVISHLTELKERITTHIELIPSSNGHSKIKIKNTHKENT